MNASTTSQKDSADASTAAANSNDVFISYSRKDQAFVKTLDAAFKRLNRNPWVDWEDIRKGEEWWAAIQRGIEGANTFVFVISPDSIASSVCRDEIDYAARCNKRFLPIVRREGFDAKQVHPQISSHNWLFFRETDDFETAFQELQTAIATDLDYVQAHTRLLVRAIEWQTKNQNSSYLLRGSDLAEASRWLISGAVKEPKPTALQAQYVHASHDAEVAKRKASQKARRTVILATVLTNILLSIGGGIWFYQDRLQAAKAQLETDLAKALQMGLLGIDGDEFAALAKLQTPEGKPPVNNPLYQRHQKWLASVRTVFPNSFERTYFKGAFGETYWVGDVSRDLPEGKGGTKFLHPFRLRSQARSVLAGNQVIFMTPHADYQDKLGSVISAFGPIKTSTGEIVGGLRVDYTETYLISEENDVRRTLMLAYLIIFFWLVVLSLLILRATRSLDR